MNFLYKFLCYLIYHDACISDKKVRNTSRFFSTSSPCVMIWAQHLLYLVQAAYGLDSIITINLHRSQVVLDNDSFVGGFPQMEMERGEVMQCASQNKVTLYSNEAQHVSFQKQQNMSQSLIL